MIYTFKIIMNIQNAISIHHISLNSGCNMVLKYEPDINSSNKISFLNKNLFFDLFHLLHDQNKRRYTQMYHRGFIFSINSYGLDKKKNS
ncbi:unnamed protein product [Musa acuminata subsp. malaccensis]|uniref:(wild Malaysian banana) hypothetical protein n=1 Tax=Musa acuminata subsp. malaccensis TaxID=214687 RepID=A0A8D7B529_MUSAM|nr:unnamed protein product [Musa acuminata subsp. malaccensis]